MTGNMNCTICGGLHCDDRCQKSVAVGYELVFAPGQHHPIAIVFETEDGTKVRVDERMFGEASNEVYHRIST